MISNKQTMREMDQHTGAEEIEEEKSKLKKKSNTKKSNNNKKKQFQRKMLNQC